MYTDNLVAADAIPSDAIIVDCRFALGDSAAGREAYELGHIPGAYYLDLNSDLSGPVLKEGGRHPLPAATDFAQTLSRCGITPDSVVVAYDDSRFAYAGRLWWMMRAAGFRPPALINGGYTAWLAAGGQPSTASPVAVEPLETSVQGFAGNLNRAEVITAQSEGAVLVDAREPRRYAGLEEPIDPVAGHIPGAVNQPWLEITDEAGFVLQREALSQRLAPLLEQERLIAYCGSGVTACVILFALALLGRDDAGLYSGSWSDWCSAL